MTNLFRWIHILTAAIWLGEVVVINLVLVPALKRMHPENRGAYLASIFPRVFQLATYVVATVLVSGAALNLSLSGWDLRFALERLVSGRWGLSILAAGSLGLGLGLFHFFVESRLEPRLIAENSAPGQEEETERVMRVLAIVPRIGLGILVLVFVLMMYAARGI